MMAIYEVSPRRITGAIVQPPGSKSITNRALIAAALARGESRIVGALESDDTEAMIGCLLRLGVRVDSFGGAVRVHSTGYLDAGGRLDARASGTTARFITAAATLADGPSEVDGTDRMRERPIGTLVETLRALGASIATAGHSGYPPVYVAGGGLGGGTAAIEAGQSSQFVSAVMLAAPKADESVVLELGEPIVSRPYLETTIEGMTSFGAEVGWVNTSTIRIEPTGYQPIEFTVEADASAAVYPWAAAAITGGSVTVTGIDPAGSQADLGVLDAFEAMGCHVDRTGAGITVSRSGTLRGASLDMNGCPDAVLGVAVVAAFAESETHIHNVANLRIKETDRLAALQSELGKLGAEATTGPDWIRIIPSSTRPARIATYDDHRMAMSFAVAGLAQPGVVIEDPECVAKTWPTFFDMLESL
jgi:3-phosphoshikimate 1-carboxyvinyltransferase